MADFDTDHLVTTMINLRGKLYPGMTIILGGPLVKLAKWVNLTTTREFGVEYTNTTGKGIQVAVTSAIGNSGFSAFVDDVRVATSYRNYNTANPKHSIIIDVPPGSKYKFTGGTKDNWAEFRPA